MTKSIFLSLNFEFQSALILIRELFVGASFDLSSRIYVKFKRTESWGISRKELLQYPENTLGFYLGCFLLKHNFEPQPRCENHDVFHVLTGYQTDTAQEIALQFFLYGNGKRSAFLLLAMFAGYLLYPDHYKTFKKAQIKGQNTKTLHDFNYKESLKSSIITFKNTFNINQL
ncbi:Coq4 family protein [Leeuwenhoekiella polynyae]|uniref:Ubiquinone biosynthesis protein COQ4 n=1 Tax=Leeuwenhoekiella polynyae TaxID=1550906 RepID=A0A4Q0PGN8_9FLAO|nr:Coq4 family protein [Leeuwenhoekiella polynyae]RXG26117.1 ubiquinone biosynthesis protein COQ4 [Leeuwenhoekiella polynyae]